MGLAKFEIAPGRFVGEGCPCFIIAEIGQNHQGDVEIAKQLIKTAADCGVDCVKFQKSNLTSRFTKEVLNQPYLNSNSWGITYGQHRAHLEFKDEDFYKLKEYSENLGLYFAVTGMDKTSITFLNELGVPFFKIGSADTTNLPLLKHASTFHKPLIISTGMTDLNDICKMYDAISQLNQSIVLLQCTSCYPTHPSNVNLQVIKLFKKTFPQAVIGYSGHEQGISVSLSAVALGAKIIEKHITLDHTAKGSDHITSLEPEELKHLVNGIRDVEKALGVSSKDVQSCEIPCYSKLGKTIISAMDMVAGTVLTEDMIDCKVAVKKGYNPINFYNLIGKQIKQDIKKEETLLQRHFTEHL